MGVFIENDEATADALVGALTEVSHRWLPSLRVTSAPQYWGQATRRLVVLPATPNFFWKRRPVKFKRYHGVRKNARQDYLGNVRPRLWRAQRVRQPPPLLVFRQTGQVAPQERQRRARPYYYRGVSHILFPSRKTGFHGLRKSSRGQWVGVRRPTGYRIAEDRKPRQ